MPQAKSGSMAAILTFSPSLNDRLTNGGRPSMGDGVGIDPGRRMEGDPAGRRGREHAVDDHRVKVEVEIEKGAEAVDEDDRAEAGRGSGARTVRAQALLHRLQEHPQHGTLQSSVAVEEVAQALRLPAILHSFVCY